MHRLFVLSFMILSAFGASVEADMVVWAENSLVKVRPNDAPKPLVSAIDISAARNEFEPFQVIVRAENRSLRGVDVDLSDFLSDRGNRISCRENCTIYRELYISISRPSGLYGSTGEWPDALIPKVDRYAGERRNAFPFDIAENRNQPIWIDVYVPTVTPPGVYSAYLSVQAQGEQTTRIPVHLTVWSFALRSTSSIRNSFGVWGSALPCAHGSSFTGDRLDALMRLYSKAMLWHRLSDSAMLGDGSWQPVPLTYPSPENLARLQRDWGGFFDGTALPNGAKVTAIIPDYLMCRGTFCRADVLEFFSSAGWLNRVAVYLPDEPNLADPGVLQQTQSIGDEVHQKGYGLRTMLTHGYSSLVDRQVDDWVVPLPTLQNSFDDGSYWSVYGPEIARGKEVWLYQACFTHGCWGPSAEASSMDWPDYMIDMQGVKNRIQDWVNWKLRAQGELYWCVNYRYYSGDPYEDQFMFGGNGDGNLLYPGTPDRIGGVTDIPIESIRLKLKREGLEDYEYLSLLKVNGAESFADFEVAKIVQSAAQWEHDPALLYRVRAEIAAQIESLRRAERKRDEKEPGPWRVPGALGETRDARLR